MKKSNCDKTGVHKLILFAHLTEPLDSEDNYKVISDLGGIEVAEKMRDHIEKCLTCQERLVQVKDQMKGVEHWH